MSTIFNELKGSIALDFDGVFNKYEGWAGEDNLYDPRDGVEEFLQELLKMYHRIVIFSCRDSHKIKQWLIFHGLDKYIKDVTQTKPACDAYVDDRGLTFAGSYPDTLEALRKFKPYWKKSKQDND